MQNFRLALVLLCFLAIRLCELTIALGVLPVSVHCTARLDAQKTPFESCSAMTDE